MSNTRDWFDDLIIVVELGLGVVLVTIVILAIEEFLRR